MRVALTYNLRREVKVGDNLPDDFYAECDGIETIEAVKNAILECHETAVMVEADEDAYEKLRALRPDIVFNMAEGLWGESREAQLPAMLEMLRIPYTGSSPLSLGLCLNKARAKEVLSHYGVPNSRFIVSDNPDFCFADRSRSNENFFPFPMIVKPLFEGSSKGIKNDSFVTCPAELETKVRSIVREYSQPALIEEYLSGREFTVALMGNGKTLKVLPIVEINYASLPAGVNHIYSYEAKWIFDRPDNPLDIFNCPAVLGEALKNKIEKTAMDAFGALSLRDWCRIDIRLDCKGAPNVIELNPLPGILADPKENSCFPKAARAAGLTFGGLVNGVIDAARVRYGL